MKERELNRLRKKAWRKRKEMKYTLILPSFFSAGSPYELIELMNTPPINNAVDFTLAYIDRFFEEMFREGKT